MAKDDIRCPFCDQAFNCDVLESAEIFEERLVVASRLGSAWRLANEYIDCFRQKPGGRISHKKRLRHLKAICGLWEKCEFEFDGKKYRTTKDAIRRGLTTVCDLEKYGFGNNNYLKKCLLDTAQRISTEGLTAKEESAIETKRRSIVAEKAAKNKDTMTAQEYLKKQGVLNFAELLKRGPS